MWTRQQKATNDWIKQKNVQKDKIYLATENKRNRNTSLPPNINMSEHLSRVRINFENVGIDLQNSKLRIQFPPVTFCHLKKIQPWKIPSFQDNVLDVKLEPYISQPFDMLNITPVCQHPVVINSKATRPRLPIRNPLITLKTLRSSIVFSNISSVSTKYYRKYLLWAKGNLWYYWITREHSNSIRRVINTFVILPNQNCSTINGVSVENNKSISFLALVLHCDLW